MGRVPSRDGLCVKLYTTLYDRLQSIHVTLLKRARSPCWPSVGWRPEKRSPSRSCLVGCSPGSLAVYLAKSRGAFANHDQRLHAPPVSVGDLVYLRKWVQGRNKIQDAWEPAMFVVAATLAEDTGPFTVNQADGTGPPKRVHRAELQLCPVGFSFPQIPSESAAEPSNHQGLSSTDTDSEFLLLLNPWRTLAATRQHLEPVSLWMPTATRRTCSCTNKSVSQQHWWNSVRCSSNTLQKDSTKEDNTCYNRQAQESTQTVAVSM